MSARSMLLAAALSMPMAAHAQPSEDAPDEAQGQGAAEENEGDESKSPPPPPEAPQPPAPPATVELPDPPPAVVPAPLDNDKDDISVADWDADDWMLLKPALSLLEIDGYFRLRGDVLSNLDFGNNAEWEQGGSRFPGKQANRSADFTGANMRLRIEPTINVTDDIRIVTTIDILDNLVLGSTPDTVPHGSGAPLHLHSRGQVPPSNAFNAVTDSIVVKRAYGVATALNKQLTLTFGRMPNHWGLGMMVNSGDDCLDCDYGDVVDRISLSFKVIGHLFTGMFDWVSSGPVYVPFNRFGGQPLDQVDWDDILHFGLRASRIDHPDDIKESLANDEHVFNYGGWVNWRSQSRDIGASYYETGDPTNPTITYDPQREIDPTQHEQGRNANMIIGDVFVKYFFDNLYIGLEGALIWGEWTDHEVMSTTEANALTNSQIMPPGRQNTMLQWGAVLEASYQLKGDYSGLRFGVKGGIASGDTAPGFGALDKANTQRGFFPGRDGSEPNGYADTTLDNFQFSPNYRVDLMMYRRIIGTVTDSWFVHPWVSYTFDQKLYGKVWATYSQALYRRSTPSCMDSDYTRCRISSEQGNGPSELMGLELDAEVSYGLVDEPDGGAFRAAIMGGVLFPFSAFTMYPASNNSQPVGANFAWTLQGRLYLTF